MSNLAIRVENLGKLYRIGSKQQSYYTLRDALVDAVMTPVRRVRGLLRGESAADLHEEIWALKDVSFEVKHGEVVGIIGRNGAGKSTLLKVLSRITEPTTGCADVYGRIGALLEVGTGFHPELTGRENIYLNGAILGMSRAEINRKFDEIVDFAGVEKFIDTPVKHYSSGMGLRLGFAVAAHLEPEILIVDEVLAVGDAEFQKKCLGKMSSVAGEGRTVLFVSHNMAAVQSLCKRAVLLEMGSIKIDTNARDAVKLYLETGAKVNTVASLEGAKRSGNGAAQFEEVSICPLNSESSIPKMGDDIAISLRLRCINNIGPVVVCIVIWDSFGARIIDANTGMKSVYMNLSADRYYHINFYLKNVLLRPSIYSLELYMAIENQETIDYIPEAIRFEVIPNVDILSGTVDYPGSYRCAFDIEIDSMPARRT